MLFVDVWLVEALRQSYQYTPPCSSPGSVLLAFSAASITTSYIIAIKDVEDPFCDEGTLRPSAACVSIILVPIVVGFVWANHRYV